MNRAYVAIGAVFGDRKELIRRALKLIHQNHRVTAVSDIYETFIKDEGPHEPHLSCCAEVETPVNSLAFLEFLIGVETEVSQKEDEHHLRYSHLDCDLISFGDEVIRTPRLTLPHPEAHRRAFVMVPLAQICAQWEHPILRRTAAELAQQTYWPGWGRFYAHGESLLSI